MTREQFGAEYRYLSTLETKQEWLVMDIPNVMVTTVLYFF